MFATRRFVVFSSSLRSSGRRMSTVPEMMSAWVCVEYNRPLIRRQVRVPEITEPNQILVKIQASSVNPIDVMMCEGYANEMLSTYSALEMCRPDRVARSVGRTSTKTRFDSTDPTGTPPPPFEPNPMPAPPGPTAPPTPDAPPKPTDSNPLNSLPNLKDLPDSLNKSLKQLPDAFQSATNQLKNMSLGSQQKSPSRLPLIPGRDFCGEVVRVGSDVREVQVGDQVIGVCPITANGSHAEFALTNEKSVALKPKNVSEVEAASAVFVMATVWSALMMARISPRNAAGQRFLIHGGSGGVGTTAIQLLRAWNAEKIVATASAKNLEIIRKLGAVGVDYNAVDARDQLVRESPFDVIIDCAESPLTEWSDTLLGTWRNSIHLSLVSPLMRNTDRYGVPFGFVATAAQWFLRNVQNFTRGRLYMYAFYYPDRQAMIELTHLIESGKLKPIVNEVRTFNELPQVYEKVGRNEGGGKTVLDFAAASAAPPPQPSNLAASQTTKIP